MTAYHKQFRRFHPQTVAATRTLLAGWASLDREAREARCHDWLTTASAIYGMDAPDLHFGALPPGTVGGFYSAHDHLIVLGHPSIVTLLHEFRHAMQYRVTGAGARVTNRQWWAQIDALEADARGWSLSLYFKVAPRTFRRLVHEGRILFVSPEDLVGSR